MSITEQLGGVDASSSRKNHAAPYLGIVVPCHNEEEVIDDSYAALSEVLKKLSSGGDITDWLLLFVDDGSTDSSWCIIEKIHSNDAHVKALRFSRNFGQQPAVLAGYAACVDYGCDAVISIDADLQDDVDAIPEMVKKYKTGCDVVYGVRQDRSSDKLSKRVPAAIYYRIAKAMGVPGPYNYAEYRLLSNDAVGVLAEYPERNMFLRGVVGSMNLVSEEVPCVRKERKNGKTSYGWGDLVKLAIGSFVSFSTKPLEWTMYMGGIFCLIAIALLGWSIISFVCGWAVAGWTSLMSSIWFTAGCLMASIGILGRYIGEVVTEEKHRPRFVIVEKL